MNKRFLKMAKKAGAIINEGFDGEKNFVYGIIMSPEDLQSFAESIIKECHEVIVVGGVDDLDGVMKHFEIE